MLSAGENTGERMGQDESMEMESISLPAGVEHAPWRAFEWGRHGSSHAWPDWSATVAKPGEDQLEWFERWAGALVQELSGPIFESVQPKKFPIRFDPSTKRSIAM